MTELAAGRPLTTRWQTATVAAILTRTPRIKSFLLTPSEPFAFEAGQHVDVRLTAEDGYRAIRSYSIASAPGGGDTIELTIERLADGEVSPFFHEVVAVGDQIELRGPLGGYFVWPAQDNGPLLLIGGGSGVVPLVSMIRHRQATADRRAVALLYSARTWDDVLYRDELVALDAANDGFTLRLALTREAPQRAGDYGRRVDAAMIADVRARLPQRPQLAFICGANPFVEVAADGVLAGGIPAAAIRTERYGV